MRPLMPKNNQPRIHTRTSSQISRTGNSIQIGGRLQGGDFRSVFSEIHRAVNDAGYSDLELDFSNLKSAFPSSILPICSHIMALTECHIDFSLKLPIDKKLRNIFINANWAHLLCPRQYDECTKERNSQIPATLFKTSEEQQQTVNRFIKNILSSVTGITRQELAAIEWSLNEITDNVLNHAQSRTGGLVQLAVLSQDHRLVEISVCDAGVGIPTTLRSTRAIETDLDALELAIKEGVTRDQSVGQGNGLFGTFEICRKSGGSFRIESGKAFLSYSADQGLRLRSTAIPFDGTLIDARISLTASNVLTEALRFKGQTHTLTDIIELRYEPDEGDYLCYTLSEEATSFGSRQAARPVRVQLENLLRMSGKKIRIDFSGIPVVSSSFADEVFGRLFLELGAVAFMNRVEFKNMDPTVRSLVDAAIARRIAYSYNTNSIQIEGD